MADYRAAFICLSGDVDNVIHSEPGCFAIEDQRGCVWYCLRFNDLDQLTEYAGSLLEDLPAMQEKLKASGYFATGGTTVRVYVMFPRTDEPRRTTNAAA